jgi:hypothetical protein
MGKSLETPVLFLIFNRPDTTQRVFQAIREAKPKQLFIAADGPRENVPSDKENALLTRAITDSVDWPCEVKTLYRSQNLGCRSAVSSGISWFFSEVEEGIVLEDDCLSHPDFFYFAQEMLIRYRNSPQVMHISGGNFQFGQTRGDASYYFSRIAHIWGWASWRRAWNTYDVDMKDYPEFLIQNRKHSFFADRKAERYWLFHFNRMYKKAGTWDYQWSYAIMKNHGYCIIPNVNLISNIGFGESATHAHKKSDPVANMEVFPIKTIVHPDKIEYNEEADRYTLEVAFPIPPFITRASNKIIKTIKKFLS